MQAIVYPLSLSMPLSQKREHQSPNIIMKKETMNIMEDTMFIILIFDSTSSLIQNS